MTGRYFFPFIVAAALLPLPALAFWPFDSDSELFLRGCEEVLAERLISPSSYKLIEAGEMVRSDGDVMDYLELTTPEQIKKQAARIAKDTRSAELLELRKQMFGSGNFERVSILITYDASNSMGVALRSNAECSEYIGRGDDWSDSDNRSPRIDGLSALSWTIDMLPN